MKNEIKTIATILFYLERRQKEEESKRDDAINCRNFVSAGGFEMIAVGIITSISIIKEIYSGDKSEIYKELENMKKRN